jgi:hypothetical protein
MEAVAAGKVNWAIPKAELFSQYFAVASQKSTNPAVIGEFPAVTVAVRMIGV